MPPSCNETLFRSARCNEMRGQHRCGFNTLASVCLVVGHLTRRDRGMLLASGVESLQGVPIAEGELQRRRNTHRTSALAIERGARRSSGRGGGQCRCRRGRCCRRESFAVGTDKRIACGRNAIGCEMLVVAYKSTVNIKLIKKSVPSIYGTSKTLFHMQHEFI